MKNAFLLLLIMPIIWLTESCKKGKINHKKLGKCYDSENYDSLKLASKLVGSWEWISEYNIWADITTEADKAVHITMTSSGGFYTAAVSPPARF